MNILCFLYLYVVPYNIYYKYIGTGIRVCIYHHLHKGFGFESKRFNILLMIGIQKWGRQCVCGWADMSNYIYLYVCVCTSVMFV